MMGGRGEIITAFYWTLNKRDSIAGEERRKSKKWSIHVCEYSTIYRSKSNLHEMNDERIIVVKSILLDGKKEKRVYS